MAKEKSAIERFAESKFMRKLQEGSQKLASNVWAPAACSWPSSWVCAL